MLIFALQFFKISFSHALSLKRSPWPSFFFSFLKPIIHYVSVWKCEKNLSSRTFSRARPYNPYYTACLSVKKKLALFLQYSVLTRWFCQLQHCAEHRGCHKILWVTNYLRLVSIWSQMIAYRRSQKVLRSSAIIWKHTSAIVCDQLQNCHGNAWREISRYNKEVKNPG